jgi:hypothetical protein
MVRNHASLFKFAKRDAQHGETRGKYLLSQTNWPRLLPIGGAWGFKTNLAMNTLGVSAVGLLVGSKSARHSDDISPQDYIGTPPEGYEIIHYGVKGMKWGVRRDRDGGPRPTRARRKEDAENENAKKMDQLIRGRNEVHLGKSDLVSTKGNKQMSTKEALEAYDKDINKLAKKSPAAKKVLDDAKRAAKEDGTLTPSSDTQKYNAIRRQAMEQGVGSLNNEQLKFLNTRAEALTKAKTQFADKQSWLSKSLEAATNRALNEALNIGLREVNAAIEKSKEPKAKPSLTVNIGRRDKGDKSFDYSDYVGNRKAKPYSKTFPSAPKRTYTPSTTPAWGSMVSPGFGSQPLKALPSPVLRTRRNADGSYEVI